MKELGLRIKQLREALNLRPAELARLVGVPPQYIDNWENRGHRPSGRYANSLAQVLGITEEELLTGKRPSSKPLDNLTLRELMRRAERAADTLPGYELLSFPLVGNIAAGQPLADPQSEETTTLTTHVPRGTPENCFFLKVEGDSMTGDGILTGDLALINPTLNQKEINEKDIYALLVNQTSVTLKRLRRVGETLWMMGSNHRQPPIPLDPEHDEECRILGTLIKLERYYA